MIPIIIEKRKMDRGEFTDSGRRERQREKEARFDVHGESMDSVKAPRSRRVREINEEKEIEVMKLQIGRMAKNINYMESGKKWNLMANDKQFKFTSIVRQILVEDMRVVLEKGFGQRGGTILSSIKDVVRKGEKELDLRIKMLRMADKASWSAVNK